MSSAQRKSILPLELRVVTLPCVHRKVYKSSAPRSCVRPLLYDCVIDVTSRTKEHSVLQGGKCSDWSIMVKTRFRPVTSRRIITIRPERYSFCPARQVFESASPVIQYKLMFWIHTKVVNNAQYLEQ